MQYFVLFVKKLVIAICMIYTFDLIVSSVGIFIPINVVTILSVTFLGLPAMFGLLILKNFM